MFPISLYLGGIEFQRGWIQLDDDIEEFCDGFMGSSGGKWWILGRGGVWSETPKYGSVLLKSTDMRCYSRLFLRWLFRILRHFTICHDAS